jgi:Zn-finger nucleic acid-binding protein
VPINLDDQGYDKEEEYFFRKNKELLEKKRAELDAARRLQEKEQLKEMHWMRCPKCGHEMAEEELAGIKVDRCAHCGGVFFDAGELDLLLQSQEPAGFLGGLKRWVKR